MNACRPRISWLLVSVALLSPLLASAQQAAPSRRGRPVIFSDPNRDAGTTNLDHVATKRMTLQNLEDQLKRPFEIFDVADPSRRQVAVPPVRHLPSPKLNHKQLQALFEKDKDWAFKTPEDYQAELGLTGAEMLKIPEYNPDGSLKKKSTPMERYYERLQHPGTGATNQAGNSLFPWAKNENQRGDEIFGFEKRPATTSLLEQTSKRDGGNLLPDDATKPRTMAELFGIGSADTSAATKAQEQRLEEFKKILDPRAATPPSGPSVNLFGNANPTPGLVSPVRPTPLPGASASRDSLGFLPAIAGTPVSAQALPEAYQRPPGSTTPLTSVEKQNALPASPGFQLPKRKF